MTRVSNVLDEINANGDKSFENRYKRQQFYTKLQIHHGLLIYFFIEDLTSDLPPTWCADINMN